MSINIPSAPALPANAPVIYQMVDYSTGTPLVVDTLTLDVNDTPFTPEDPVWAAERGTALWRRASRLLNLGDFGFGIHLFCSQAANTISGTQPLLEVAITIQRGGDWVGYPWSGGYNKREHSVFPKAFKIVAKDSQGNVVHVFEMHDGLPINDPSMYQGSPLWSTTGQTNRPFVCVGMNLQWWNERPRRSASLEQMFSGITDEGMRPSASKSHFSVLSCEPQITGGYSGNSLNSLGNMWVSKEWAMPKGSYWPAAGTGDPYFNYNDTCMEGRSAFMGPWVMGYKYEAGARVGHNWYCAPGGPRFDRSFVPSQVAVWLTDPNGKRPDGVEYSEISYNFIQAYANRPNKFVSDGTRMFLSVDADFLEPTKYFTGNYYGDGGPDGPNAIRLNANQRDGTNDSHFDKDGLMPLHGWGQDGLHNYGTVANGAIALQSIMLIVLSKFDTITSFMNCGSNDRSGRGSDNDGGNYLVRDMAWDWLHNVLAYKCAANHPLGFKRADILARFTKKLEAIHRDILTPIQAGNYPEGMKYYYEGIARFGQPLSRNGWGWQCHGGGLAFYLGGVLMYMKQSGMYADLQAQGGKAYEALMFTIRNACQYAFGIFSQTKATMFSNPTYGKDAVFADGTNIPADWKEWSAAVETDGSDFNMNADGTMRKGDRDVSVHPTIQFIFVMEKFFPEIEHEWKADAIAKVNMYLDRQTAAVKALEGKPQEQRDADHIYRYPGVAPLKAPVQVGPGAKVALPVVPVRKMTAYVAPEPVVAPEAESVSAPAPVGEGEWLWCGKEGSVMIVQAGLTMRYGSGGKCVYKVSDGVEFTASNGYFGADPVPGITKDVHRFIPAVVEPEPVVEPEVVEPEPVPVPETPVEEPAEPQIPVQVDPAPETEPTPEPEPEPTPVEPLPEPVVVLPTVDYPKAYEAAAKAFLEALGYVVTK